MKKLSNTNFSKLSGQLLRLGALLGAGLGLTWGGNWKTFIDRPHYEIPPNQIDSFIIPKKKEDDELVEKTTMKINGKEVQVERILKENRNCQISMTLGETRSLILCCLANEIGRLGYI